jgi:ABC-type polysaccharide/polyol phosphate export permease
VIQQIQTLYRYRLLIHSLVSRELKARYRGNILGFMWSFINPLMLLLTYGLVFTYMLPGFRGPTIEPYFLFLFCGLLPWTWFSSSILESSTVLIAGGNLIKKVLFPAEILPTVTVLANFVHFMLGMPILLAFLVWEGRLGLSALLLPIPLLVQMVMTLGLALFFSALTVHFRDVKDLLSHLLNLWFFSTPVLYSYAGMEGPMRTALRLNPMTHVLNAYHDLLFGNILRIRSGLAGSAIAALILLALGAFLFDRLRDTLAEEV